MITEESFIDFRCPYCGETISFPRENAGHPQACPGCTESVIVPEDGSPEGGKLPLPITTQRLVLRRFAPVDWQDLLECLSDEETFRHMDGRPLEEEDVLHWLERERQVKLTTPDQAFYLGIQSQESDKLIGYVSLSFPEPPGGTPGRAQPGLSAQRLRPGSRERRAGFLFRGNPSPQGHRLVPQPKRPAAGCARVRA